MPEKWNNTKKIVATVKQQVAPLQANEVANVRRRSAAFDVKQHEYREEFRRIAPFMYSCPNSYEEINQVSTSPAVAASGFGKGRVE